MKYAVNVADLTKDLILARFAFAPVINNQAIVQAEKGRVDGGAVLMDCDSQRAESLLWLVRRKYHKNLLRIYRSKTGRGGWKRI